MTVTKVYSNFLPHSIHLIEAIRKMDSFIHLFFLCQFIQFGRCPYRFYLRIQGALKLQVLHCWIIFSNLNSRVFLSEVFLQFERISQIILVHL